MNIICIPDSMQEQDYECRLHQGLEAQGCEKYHLLHTRTRFNFTQHYTRITCPGLIDQLVAQNVWIIGKFLYNLSPEISPSCENYTKNKIMQLEGRTKYHLQVWCRDSDKLPMMPR